MRRLWPIIECRLWYPRGFTRGDKLFFSRALCRLSPFLSCRSSAYLYVINCVVGNKHRFVGSGDGLVSTISKKRSAQVRRGLTLRHCIPPSIHLISGTRSGGETRHVDALSSHRSPREWSIVTYDNVAHAVPSRYDSRASGAPWPGRKREGLLTRATRGPRHEDGRSIRRGWSWIEGRGTCRPGLGDTSVVFVSERGAAFRSFVFDYLFVIADTAGQDDNRRNKRARRVFSVFAGFYDVGTKSARVHTPHIHTHARARSLRPRGETLVRTRDDWLYR